MRKQKKEPAARTKTPRNPLTKGLSGVTSDDASLTEGRVTLAAGKVTVCLMILGGLIACTDVTKRLQFIIPLINSRLDLERAGLIAQCGVCHIYFDARQKPKVCPACGGKLVWTDYDVTLPNDRQPPTPRVSPTQYEFRGLPLTLCVDCEKAHKQGDNVSMHIEGMAVFCDHLKVKT